MTAAEVTVLHVVAEAEEAALSFSSKVVAIIAEKDMENEKENLSNGTNNDGSYVGDNGNDAVDGVPTELNLERNGNCVGEEDGEGKSESDSVRDESCIGTGDQEEEPIELCHVESPVEGDPVSAVNSEDGVLETSPEDAVFDFSVEISAASDCNGDGLVEESFDDKAEAEFDDKETVMIKDSIDSTQSSQGKAKASVLVFERLKSETSISSIVSVGDISFAADVQSDRNNNSLTSSVSNPDCESQVSDTVVIKDSVDSSQNSLQVVNSSEIGPSVEGGKSSNITENVPSMVLYENVIVDSCQNSQQDGKSYDIVETGPSALPNVNVTIEGGKSSGVEETGSSAFLNENVIVEGGKFSDIEATRSSLVQNENVTVETVSSDAGGFVLVFGSFPLMLNNASVGSKSGVNGIMAETLLPSHDDPKIETETIKSDENSEGVSSLISERDISSGSIVSEEVEKRSDGNSASSTSHPISEQICALTNGGIQLGNSVNDVERKMSFNYLIKVPRYNDEDLKEKIRLANICVDEKTQSRDAIRIEMQSMRATCKEYGNDFNAAVSLEREARDLHRSKRQEIESMQSVMDIEDIDVKIRNLEHTIQHETLPLKDEKNFIREIKQLKQTREKLSSTMGRQDEMQQGLDRKERLKSLKKEADQLKANVLKAEAVTKAAKRKYYDESEKLNKLQSRFKAADNIQQEAYAQMRSLKKQSYEKSKHFWQYKDDLNTASDLALKGSREAFHSFCTNQVEKFMDLWNKNDEFRKEYVRCNARSTIRRLRTLDGRALGPDEEPPVIPQVVNERVAKDHTASGLTSEDQTQEKVVLGKAEKEIDIPVAKVVEQKREASKSGKPVIPREEKLKRTKEEEEEEEARKAEELRKEEEVARKADRGIEKRRGSS
ncbi:hypothetical protein HRI_000044700 [Hibiscus trionum]|uniref:Uncharacterized protein n=1 Tax=Hibiscus trionum TaxID=183268 RepID=A0A9W7LH23_HIBTR|nr:hypothetical protein HRI_000044700 [Hibiscus trionum]